MKIAQKMVDGVMKPAIRAGGYAAAVVLLAMMLLTITDVVLRKFFNHPILGGIEISESMLLVFCVLAIVYCGLHDAHVHVDIIVCKLNKKAQNIIDLIGYLLGLVLLIPMTLVYIPEAIDSWEMGQVSTILRIPELPFYILTVIGFALFCCVLIVKIVKTINGMVEK